MIKKQWYSCRARQFFCFCSIWCWRLANDRQRRPKISPATTNSRRQLGLVFGARELNRAYGGQVKTSVKRSHPQQKTGCTVATRPVPLAVALLAARHAACNCNCHSNFELRAGWAGRVFRSTSRVPLKVLCTRPLPIGSLLPTFATVHKFNFILWGGPATSFENLLNTNRPKGPRNTLSNLQREQLWFHWKFYIVFAIISIIRY